MIKTLALIVVGMMQTIPAIDLLEQVWMKEKATEGL